MINKTLTKWFKSIEDWLNRRYIELPDGYGDPEGPYVGRFNDELQRIEHGQHREHRQSNKPKKKEIATRS